jgi:hypothetical protein
VEIPDGKEHTVFYGRRATKLWSRKKIMVDGGTVLHSCIRRLKMRISGEVWDGSSPSTRQELSPS